LRPYVCVTRSFDLNLIQQRYITKVRIENFQSHEDTEFDLTPGINLIVGSSEAGKSAILRAINWALHNEPRGDDFVRVDADEARVHLWWNDGSYFCRIKGENRNAVTYRDKDGYEDGRDRIGTTLPPEALKVLGNPPIDDESGPISYADQHQPLFLVTLSHTELPRAISRLTGIDDFEEAAELLNKKTNSANKQIKDSTKRIEHYDTQLKPFDNLDENLKRLEQMERLSSQIDEISETVSAAKRLKDNYEDLMVIGRTANAALKQADKLAVFADKLTPVKSLLNDVTHAKRIRVEYKNLVSLDAEARDALRVSEGVCNDKNSALCEEVKNLLSKRQEAVTLKRHHETIMETGRRINKELSDWSVKIDDKNKEKTSIVAEMKAAGVWCGVCQRPKAMDECKT